LLQEFDFSARAMRLLDDFTFRALTYHHALLTSWNAPLRDRQSDKLAAARSRFLKLLNAMFPPVYLSANGRATNMPASAT
jgi:hypothetical protein